MATIINLPFMQTASVKPHRVYWKYGWTESWQLDEDVCCVTATKACNPLLDMATLTNRYGSAIPPGGLIAEIRHRKSGKNRYFVKIEFDTFAIESAEPKPLRWYGVLEIDADNVDGNVKASLPVGVDNNAYPSGRQQFECYGLGFLLDYVIVTNSMVANSSDEFRIGRGLEFNFDGRPNRTKDLGAKNAYLFSPKLKSEDRAWWSTKDAVEYLLTYHVPVNDAGNERIRWELRDDDAALPTWDHVDMPTHGQSTLDLLNSLISRQRLLGYRIEPDDNETNILFKPFTFAGADILLPQIPGAKIKANPNKIRIDCEYAADAELSVKKSTLDEFDRVVIQGARRTSTFTTSFTDSTIETGWTAALENEYEAAASTAADYPAAGEVEERVVRNYEARKADKFKSVFAYFKIPDDWDGMAGDGIGGAKNFVFPDGGDPEKNMKFYAPEQFILPRLRLLDGIDYEGDRIELEETAEIVPGPHERLHPVVLFPRYDAGDPTDKWRHVDNVGMVANLETYGIEETSGWSARVEVPENNRGLLVRVVNMDQHVIAKTDFTPLAGVDEFLGDADFYEAVFTVCIEWDHYTEGVWPAAITTPTDAARTLVLNLGANFRCDYIVPQTIYGIEPKSGTALRTTGGYVRDDRKILNAIARMAYEWYSTPRRSVSFGTSRINGDLQIGQFIESLGDPAIPGGFQLTDINSVITSLTIDVPYVEAEGAAQIAPPRIRYETAFGELDQVKFIRTFSV